MTELVKTVLPVHVRERSGGRLQPQLADWWKRFALPRTGAMHREVLNTLDLSAHTLEREEPRWAFEWVIATGKRLALRVETEPDPWFIVSKEAEESWSTWEPKLEIPAGLTIPFPPETDEPAAWKRWRADAGRELVAQFEALWSYTPKAVEGLAGSAPKALTTFKREEPKRLRDLKWLALKQAGLSAAEIADRDGPEQGVSEEGVRKALRRAADEIGLAQELIRRAKAGRKPAS